MGNEIGIGRVIRVLECKMAIIYIMPITSTITIYGMNHRYVSAGSFINKIFDYAIVFGLFLASKDFQEINSGIENIEEVNKQLYNLSDLGLIARDAFKSF